MTLIIAVSGKKSSGKTSLCNYLHHFYSQLISGIENEDSIIQLPDGSIHSSLAHIGLDEETVRVYNFADSLKDFCVNVLGLSEAQCWGSDREKNTLTKYKWQNLSKIFDSSALANKHGLMTAREVMQVFGTDVIRKLFDDDIWIDATIRRIQKDNSDIALIADVRFPLEVKKLRSIDARIVRLTRSIFESDQHDSETALDNYDFSDYSHSLTISKDVNLKQQSHITVNWLKETINYGL